MLLPPSEGKATGGGRRGWEPDTGPFSALADDRRAVVDALTAARGGSQKLLGVKGEHFDRAQSANLALGLPEAAGLPIDGTAP